MGLFDFVRGIGKKVFSHDEEAAEESKTEIESAKPGVSALDMHYDPQSGTVALSGQATSAEAMQMSDTKQTPPSADEADVEREVRLGRKFSLSEAIGHMGGKGILKGESPIAPIHQTEAEIANYLRAHLKDSGGVLAEVVLRHMRTSEVLLKHVNQPMVVLVSYVHQVLQSEMLLKDLVREADAEWGRAYDARPYFEREGHPSHPDDPYTLATVHDALMQLVERATRDDE